MSISDAAGIQLPCEPDDFTFDCYPGQGSAILAEDNAGASNITVGGSPTTKCEFLDCTHGITCYWNVNLDAQYNLFNNASYDNENPSSGIYSLSSTGTTKNIVSNDFHSIEYGVNIIDPIDDNINIDQNLFNHSSPYPTSVNRIAIYVGSVQPNSSGDRFITNNLISTYGRGILTTNQRNMNVGGLGISGNSIAMENTSHTNTWYAIADQNGMENIISLNTIYTGGTSNSTLEQILYGISIETSENNIISENTITKMGTGIRFYNSHIKNTISCNELNGSYRQITMEASYVGDQGNSGESSDNTWTRGANTDANLCAIGTSLSNKWWIQSVTNSYFPGTGTGEMVPALHFALGLASPSTTCVVPCNNPSCIQDQLAGIVKCDVPYVALSAVEEYLIHRRVFETLLMDTSLMYQNTVNDTILKVFYDSLMNGNTKKFLEVKNFIIDEDASNAESKNNSISPAYDYESNEKSINEIYIDNWMNQEIITDSTTKVNLQEIALQNPLIAGTSAYSARVLLNLDVSDNYIASEERMRAPKFVDKKNSIENGSIFPNPNNGLMQILLSDPGNSNVVINIYDNFGTLVRNFIRPKSNLLTIDLTEYPSGVYIAKIILSENNSFYDKIIIQK